MCVHIHVESGSRCQVSPITALHLVFWARVSPSSQCPLTASGLSLCCFPQHWGYRWAPACLAFSRGSRIWTPILMPVWQALRWLSHLPCPSFIVFLWFWSTFFTMGVAFVEQFANPFLGLHKILILLLFWVPLLSRAQDILFTSRGLFFLKGLLHFCALDQLFQDLQGWIMSCLCPAEAQFISTVLKYISGIRSQNSSHYVQIPQNTDLVFSN